MYLKPIAESRFFRLVGFEELGGNDAFTTGALELRLTQSGRRNGLFWRSVVLTVCVPGVLAKPADDHIPTMYGTSGSSKPSAGYSRAVRDNDDDGSDLDI
jgi:hypothetical protein